MSDGTAVQLTRRGFMAASAVAGFAAAKAPADPARAIRTALIGCGRGGENAARLLRDGNMGLRLVTLSDANAARMHQLGAATGASTEPDWKRLLARPDIDAVIIATPDDCHAEMAMAALASGKHVYLLPPVAHTAADARTLYGSALESGCVLYTGMEQGSSARWMEARTALGSRDGAPRWIQAGSPCLPAPDSSHWSGDGSRSLGPAARQILNVLYPLQHHLALGAPQRVTAVGGAAESGAGTPTALAITARYENGATVVLTCSDSVCLDRPAIVRGPWAAVELPREADAAGVAALDLDGFAEAIARGPHAAAQRLRDACTAQAALCEAVRAVVNRSDTVL